MLMSMSRSMLMLMSISMLMFLLLMLIFLMMMKPGLSACPKYDLSTEPIPSRTPRLGRITAKNDPKENFDAKDHEKGQEREISHLPTRLVIMWNSERLQICMDFSETGTKRWHNTPNINTLLHGSANKINKSSKIAGLVSGHNHWVTTNYFKTDHN